MLTTEYLMFISLPRQAVNSAQQICMTLLFQLVSIAKVSSPQRYWYREIWYRDILWYRQYRPTLP